MVLSRGAMTLDLPEEQIVEWLTKGSRSGLDSIGQPLCGRQGAGAGQFFLVAVAVVQHHFTRGCRCVGSVRKDAGGPLFNVKQATATERAASRFGPGTSCGRSSITADQQPGSRNTLGGWLADFSVLSTDRSAEHPSFRMRKAAD